MTSMGAKKASKGRKRAIDEDNASQHTSASSDVMFFGFFRCVSAGLELLVAASGTLAGSVMLLGRCDGALLALSRSQLVGPVAARDGPRDRSGPLGTSRDRPGPAGTSRDARDDLQMGHYACIINA